MRPVDRRTFTRAVAALMLSPLLALAQAQARRLRLLLNTSLSGPVAFFLLAQDRGYLRDEGLDIALTTGGGAAVIVPQVKHGAYDIGYGDLSALIERIARGERDQGPVAIYTTFNVVPFTIAVAANGPIKTAKDLEGRRIVGHAGDAALLTFDLYARAAGIDVGTVRVQRSMQGMGAQVADMLRGDGADAVFGFVNTIVASAAPLGIDGHAALRFLNFAVGIGDMDDARLARLIALIVETKRLPRLPALREVFDRSFLPPDAQRIRSLAR